MDLDSWTDHGRVGIDSYSGNAYNAIDPNLFLEGSTYYIQFGSFWGDIYQVEMNSEATKAAGDSYNIAYDPSGDHAEEGSYMYSYGDYYYLFYSAGICCGYDTSLPAAGDEYKIKVCRSTSASGAFVDADGTACTDGGGTIVLESHGTVYGPGGQGVFTDPTLGPVLYYHYINTTIGYADDEAQFGWNTIDFSTGWPVV
ncbi:Arabinan endo-1,5-alpha-L-arabinosidase A [Talaromyces atroroseus]|uniref:Endo-1,5-alpha-L-arabinanase A n=1 Tax=Talaromyces atroroseus TaxID=1441469 RepID=A0A225A6G1_TALAT|nr:Arabinan endo-1,5-alpha-L-arabinosidase A [Talaromyces atroroseus]OKL55972.1 Arabinan endo-1,5-alpha-L-arabinosidase A [Talaromyces atroroseus]